MSSSFDKHTPSKLSAGFYTGVKFNDIINKFERRCVIYDELKHKTGLNVDSKFNLNSIYFTDTQNMSRWLRGEWIRHVEIPADAVVHVRYDGRYTTNQIILSDKEHITVGFYEECLSAIRYNGSNIRFISNPSYVLCLEAVTQDGNAIQYINDQGSKSV
jgi:hypothetical protein